MILRAFNLQSISENQSGDTDDIRRFIISNERRDSHGTIIKMDAWDFEDYNKSGAFYYQHMTGGNNFNDPNPDNALGPGYAYKENGNLMGMGKFEPESINPLAAKIKAKIDFGTLSATSVGFMPYEGHWGLERNGEDPETYYFTKAQLKEFSIVHIPSNPDAIKKSFENYDIFMQKTLDSHKSDGFKKDYAKHLNNIRAKREYLLNLAELRNFI